MLRNVINLLFLITSRYRLKHLNESKLHELFQNLSLLPHFLRSLYPVHLVSLKKHLYNVEHPGWIITLFSVHLLVVYESFMHVLVFN